MDSPPDPVLLVEDEESVRFGVARHLERSGFRVVEADSCRTAREQFRACQPSAVVTDFRLPDGEALELIAAFRRERPLVPVVVFTGYGTIDLAVQAVKTGAHHLFTKPVDLDRLVQELRGACHPESARASAVRAATPPLLRSKTLHRFNDEIERLKDVDCSLLILGETGSGKTVLARWLHDQSNRSARPFVDLNCAGLARDLVEAELFGHERGAFTSAHAAKPGMFEQADGGTLFLDEIGDIDLAVQPKILKAIDEKRFRRVGSVRERKVDVRVISATHRDLREAARANTFRADLYYRLSTVTITVPALRERRADVPYLARDLMVSIAAAIGRPAPSLSSDALAALQAHSWPGNLRELKNVLERAVRLVDAPVVTARDLRIEHGRPGEATPASTLRDIEREQIERALAMCGSAGEAAKTLGISRSSIYLKIKEYGLHPGRSSVPRTKARGSST